MPRCNDDWRRGGSVDIHIKTHCDDENQAYSLVYVYPPRHDDSRPLLAGGSFTSSQLEQGVQIVVPEGYRCVSELRTDGDEAIATTIRLDDEQVHDEECKPSGPAGIAGYWTVTAMRQA